ncbi:MAG: GNAT family N-acetyltransferase, partial [Abditibacteriales bacterium]|nr:GNAT family N-acetyltransferase [Abditibacteriales bacterium]MDW8365558.1 GNAT family N-acetyltransferase [Abditibacteriales bacterium]
MIEVEFHKRINPQWWNERLMASPDGNVFQTTYWAEYLRAQDGVEPLYALARDGEEVVGMWLLCLTSEGRGWQRPLLSRLLPTLSWEHGPIVWGEAAAVLRALCAGLDRYATRHRIARVRGHQPPACHTLYAETFAAQGFQVKPWETFRVNTQRDETALRAALKSAARRDARHAEAQGIAVTRAVSRAEWQIYEQLLRAARERVGLPLPPHYPNAVMWEHLRPHGCSEVFLAWHEGRPVAGEGALVFNGIVSKIGVGSSQYAVEHRLYVGDALQWFILRWACAQGHRVYDVAG